MSPAAKNATRPHWVRAALIKATLRAAELLGHPYAISGRVIHGNKLGRDLGSRR